MQWRLELFLCRVAPNLSLRIGLQLLVQRACGKNMEELGRGMPRDAAGRLPPQASPWPSNVAGWLCGKHN